MSRSQQYLYQVQWSYPEVLLGIAMANQGQAWVKFKVELGLLHLNEYIDEKISGSKRRIFITNWVGGALVCMKKDMIYKIF